jgi:parvulin-like peptidyl-prolyl isomerase
MSPISRMPAVSFRDRAPSFRFLLPVLILAGLLLAGCGGGGDADKDTVIATVGDVELTSRYYENRLAKMEEGELPRAEDGTPLDTATIEGKVEFLNTLISKEVMVLTAEQLGYDQDPNVVMARSSLTSSEAGQLLWIRVIEEPANSISNEELDAFYAKLGSSRKCRYIITNFLVDAEAAREYAQTGADWDDVIDKFHDGAPVNSGAQAISVPYGRYNIEFENGVYGTEIGGITPPIKTIYGYWVLSVDEEALGKKAPLEQAKAQILDITRNRKLNNLKEDFRKEVRAQYEFMIDEESLWVAFKGMPDNEHIFQEGTKTPTAKEDLLPLDIAAADLGRVFYSYVNPKEGLREYTLGDYKVIFDAMSVFQRPKKAEMLGGIRVKIESALDKTLMNFKAEDMGLFEDPEVVDKVDVKIEEMMVHKLYTELVNIDKRVTEEQINAFWAEHSHEYAQPEKRYGQVVVALNEAKALEAQAALEGGASWRDVLLQYGTDRENKERGGRLDGQIRTEGDPVSTALFSLEPGAMSAPFEVGAGRYGFVQLERIEEAGPVQLSAVREVVGQRIRNIRQEEAFNELLDKWRAKVSVTIHEDKLESLASWEELTTEVVPENMVPRN